MYNKLLNKIKKGYVVNFFSYKEDDLKVLEFESVVIREDRLTYFYEDEPAKRLYGNKIIKDYLKKMVENTLYNKENFELIAFKKDVKTKTIYIDFKKFNRSL